MAVPGVDMPANPNTPLTTWTPTRRSSKDFHFEPALVGATPKELRYWEKVLPELQPRRSKGNLRYYHLEELARLQRIRQWLTEGFTVLDCRELLQGVPLGSAMAPAPSGAGELRFPGAKQVQAALKALRALHARLGVPPGEALPADAAPEVPPLPTRVKRGAIQKTPAPAPPIPGTLLLEPEAVIEVPGPAAPPKRLPRLKVEEAVPDSMWSGGRLPLEAEE